MTQGKKQIPRLLVKEIHYYAHVNDRAGGSNFKFVRQNTTDKKPLDSVCIHILEHVSM